jgi:serine/threonine protein kinase
MNWEKQIFEGKLGKCLYRKFKFIFFKDECGRKIGKGTYGWVNVVKHLQSGKEMAIRIFKPISDEEATKSDIKVGFNKELQSPYTLNYLDQCRDPTGAYQGLIMELMELSLEAFVKPHFRDQGFYVSSLSRKVFSSLYSHKLFRNLLCCSVKLFWVLVCCI